MSTKLKDSKPYDAHRKHFRFAHLKTREMRSVSEAFCNVFDAMGNLPVNAESVAGLRKLLEAKDCAVRSVLPDDA